MTLFFKKISLENACCSNLSQQKNFEKRETSKKWLLHCKLTGYRFTRRVCLVFISPNKPLLKRKQQQQQNIYCP